MKFGALLLKDQESSLVTGLFVFRISFALDKCPYLQCTVTCAVTFKCMCLSVKFPKEINNNRQLSLFMSFQI